jgi:hypothetical protein
MMQFVRYWLPGTVVLAGVLVMAIGHDDVALEGGGAIVGAGLSVWLINLLYRIGAKGDRERDEEDEARGFFELHGYWPDEEPPPGAGPAASPHRTPPPHAPHRAERLPRKR